MKIHKSHRFKDDKELLDFITREIKSYVNTKDDNKILYRYNRMTVEEIAQEVIIKLLRTVKGDMNKRYVRQAVMYVCIDFYRKTTEESPKDLQDQEAPEDIIPDRLLQLDKFTAKELDIVLLLLEGRRNPEVRAILDIPKMTYYTILKRLKVKYSSID